MKQIITSVALLMATATVLHAQTTATNWTATDCANNSHTLFNELDAGKVIVFVWVMPCGTCVSASKTAYNIVQSYATSNPGKVLLYLADDLGDYPCNSLANWVTTNNIGNTANMTIFSNSGNVINENDFGGSGMPHVVVMGGTDHKIYFNGLNGAANNATAIQNAINAALTPTGVADLNSGLSFTVAPNPTAEKLTINYAKPISMVTVTAANGQVVSEEVFPNGKVNHTVDLSKIASGVYTVRITDMNNKTGVQKIVKQ